jgi:uncharacterized membrane protein
MAETNPNARLEAFSDGVFAIAMTLLIIDIKLPAAENLTTTADVWRALRHLAPSVFAFVLSFIVILITWVNHHGNLRMIRRSSAPFIYANGFLLLTVVVIPFPTSLLGEFLWTDHSAPAVILYNAVLSVQAISWILFCDAVLKGRLTDDERSKSTIRENGKKGYYALILYAFLAVAAFWFPLAVAAITTLTWAFWLLLGIRMKDA